MLRQQVGDQIGSFIRKVSAAPVPLSDAIERHEAVVLVKIQAARDNSGSVYIGNRQQQHLELTAGEKEDFPVSRLNQIYFKGTAGDKIRVLVISTTGTMSPPVGA
jgi:hypothetical protein